MAGEPYEDKLLTILVIIFIFIELFDWYFLKNTFYLE